MNCCSPQDAYDPTKSDDPDVAAKKIKIPSTAQRSVARSQDQNEVVESEKTLQGEASLDEKSGVVGGDGKGELSEKIQVEDDPPRISREAAGHDQVSPVATGVNPAPIATGANAGDYGNPSSSQQDTPKAPVVVVPNHKTAPDVNVIGATPTQSDYPNNSDKHDAADSRRSSDVEMPDAPPTAPSIDEEPLDEPVQPAELQPQTPLPPPPPLSKRQEQVATKETPPVPEPAPEKTSWLLPPIQPRFKGRKCLVLDLDETLVHSSFKILNQADFTIPVEIEGQYHNVYVIKRPGVDAFMKRVGELYEVVVFTASVSKYGDPLLDQLDIHHVVHHRLFRESCYNHQGNYVKVRLLIGFGVAHFPNE